MDSLTTIIPDDKNIKGLNRLTINARRAIKESFDLAQSFGATEITAKHLLFTLIKGKSHLVTEVLTRVGVDLQKTIGSLEKSFKDEVGIGNIKSTIPQFSNEFKDIINESFKVSSELKNVYVGTEHLLLAIFNMKDLSFVRDLAIAGINSEILKRTLLNIGNYSVLPGAMMDEERDDQEEGFSSQSFVRDLNELSAKKAFFDIAGRDAEISRLIHILARKTKNNPILVGEAGVGKTAIIEGFVNNIMAKNVPTSFLNKRVLSIEVGSIVAGAKLRGDVEERIIGVINEALEDGNTILFIDEIHMIVGAGSTGSGKDSMDIANILKPYLTNSNLSIIGATTYDEYTKFFESDSALARRFQPIYVEELTVENTKKVMHKIVKELENFHKVKIGKEEIDLAVDLSSKYIKDRFLPDKAIDLLDEAAAAVKIGKEIQVKPEIDEISKKLFLQKEKKEKALKQKNYKLASKYKKEEEESLKTIEELVSGNVTLKNSKRSRAVTADLIKETIVSWTKIPIAASDIDNKKLEHLGDKIKQKIYGQNSVVSSVAKTLQKSHLGLSSDKRPLGSFLFLGPTGVGKTELAKTIAQELFGSTNLLFQINMSEYMESHSVAKLIGSPPGYVGYQEGGQLTTFVKKKPYSVILFDELEKAHPDVLNILLQILDEGELVSGRGNKVSFKNTVVIITSNIGAENVSKDSKLGFDVAVEGIEKAEMETAFTDMRDSIMERLKAVIRPELLNRIDQINVFRGLNIEDCLNITHSLVNEFKLLLASRGIILEVPAKIEELINNNGYSKEYGARNIKRSIQEYLENPLAEFLMAIPSKKLDAAKNRIKTVRAYLEKDGKTVKFKLLG